MKILAITPSDKDGNNFWRCSGPLRYMEKRSQGEIRLDIYSYDRDMRGIFSCDMDGVDLLFLHRPSTEQDVKAMQLAYMMNVPVWVDWDDAIFHIPKSNPNSSYYLSPVVRRRIQHLIRCADLLTVSTPELRSQMLPLNPNTVTVPNAYRSDLFSRFTPAETSPRSDVILWRGSNTHSEDLLSVVEQFKRIKKKITFFGTIDWPVLSRMEPLSYELKAPVDHILYWHEIQQMSPRVWIVPLQDHVFNRCKSNIAWMEAMHAGAICVAPNWPEWKHLGCVAYDPLDPNTFCDAVLDSYLASPMDLQEAKSEMIQHYDISVINKMRLELAGQLVSGQGRSNQDPFAAY